MPRFFFHLHDGDYVRDHLGAELPDIGAARDFARDNAIDMVCADIRAGRLNLDHRIDMADEDGAVIEGFMFREAFQTEG